MKVDHRRKNSVTEFKRLERLIEDSESTAEEARWAQAHLASEACESEMSQREFAGKVGKDPAHINRIIHVWRKWGSVDDHQQQPTFTDAYRMVYTKTETVEASKEVDQLRKRLPAAPEKRAEFLAEQLTADGDIAGEAIRKVIAEPSLASRRIKHVVEEREAEQRRKRKEEEQRSLEARAMPLPAYMAKMIIKIGDWARDLAFLVDNLEQLPDGPDLELLLKNVTELERQAGRWREKLDRRPDLTVIEGKAGIPA